jgi:hypothetical protein
VAIDLGRDVRVVVEQEAVHGGGIDPPLQRISCDADQVRDPAQDAARRCPHDPVESVACLTDSLNDVARWNETAACSASGGPVRALSNGRVLKSRDGLLREESLANLKKNLFNLLTARAREGFLRAPEHEAAFLEYAKRRDVVLRRTGEDRTRRDTLQELR